MFDISICIPTYNRAHLLRQCLEDLAQFQDSSFELVIGNNASDDDTEAVVAELCSHFQHCVYLRHKTNIGFARNMDSILRRATRKYVYVLSDDDIAFENALKLSESLMDANRRIIAVVGKYLSLRTLDGTAEIDFSDAIATTLPQGAHAALLDNLSICDGHPIIRREIFERHCAYLDRTGTLIPLYFDLLHHGDIVAVNKPFFQHRTTNESLTSRMADAWFLDMANADLEMAISGYGTALPPGAMQNARQRLLQLLYLQAARMSVCRNVPYLLWLFLRRLQALDGTSDELLIKCEYHFSHELILDRITAILTDGEIACVTYLDSDATRVLVQALANSLPAVEFISHASHNPEESGSRMTLCKQRSDALDSGEQGPILAIDDLFAQIRLTRYSCRLSVADTRLMVEYSEPAAIQALHAPSQAFQVICAPYSQTD